MGYYNFPHTRNFDSDLGFLIHSYIELMDNYKKLIDVYSRIEDKIQDVVLQLFQNGDIQLDAIYDQDDESISFTFVNNMKHMEVFYNE